MARTAFQTVYEVHTFHERMEKKAGDRLSAKKVAQMYQEHVRQAQESEQRTESMIDMCMTVYRRAFTNKNILECLRWCDNEFGKQGPLNTVGKLHACITRTKDTRRLEWLFTSIVDIIRMGRAEASEISVRQITGGSAGKKGFGDVLIKKQELLEYIIDTWLPSVHVDSKIMALLRQHTMTHADFRKYFAPYKDGVASLSWKRGWTNSSELVLGLIDSLIYSSALDASIKCGVKNRKSVSEICDYIPVKELMEEITMALNNERNDPGNDNQGSIPGQGGALPTPGVAQATQGAQGTGTSTQEQSTMDDDDDDNDDEDENSLAYWRKRAERVVDSNVQLIVEPSTESQLTEAIKRSILKDSLGSAGGNYVACLLDVKQLVEPITAPHSRVMPCKRERVMKLVGSFLRARGDKDKKLMRDGDCILLLDGGKRGNFSKLIAPVKEFAGPRGMARKTVNLVYCEESVKAKKERVKGVNAVSQQEAMHIVSRTAYDVPERKRLVYAGSNRGDTMAFLRLPPWESCWLMSFDDKKRLWAKSRVAVGGKTFEDGDSMDEDFDDDIVDDGPDIVPPSFSSDGTTLQAKPKTRVGSNYEPVSFHPLPLDFYKDVLSSYFIKDMFDATPGDGTAARACLASANVGYVGIVCSDFHGERLRDHLVTYMLTLFGEPQSWHYKPKYKNPKKRAAATLIAGAPEPKQGKTERASAGAKPKNKAGKKDGKNKRGKRTKKESSDDSSDDSSASESGDSI